MKNQHADASNNKTTKNECPNHPPSLSLSAFYVLVPSWTKRDRTSHVRQQHAVVVVRRQCKHRFHHPSAKSRDIALLPYVKKVPYVRTWKVSANRAAQDHQRYLFSAWAWACASHCLHLETKLSVLAPTCSSGILVNTAAASPLHPRAEIGTRATVCSSFPVVEAVVAPPTCRG